MSVAYTKFDHVSGSNPPGRAVITSVYWVVSDDGLTTDLSVIFAEVDLDADSATINAAVADAVIASAADQQITLAATDIVTCDGFVRQG